MIVKLARTASLLRIITAIVISFWLSVGFVSAQSATGGTITDVGGYRLHTFSSVGTSTFTVTGTIPTIEYLIVGGGGGAYTGGGGGGGVLMGTMAGSTTTVSVGAGGVSAGGNGGNSTAFGLIALGGGGGAQGPDSSGNSGASGGGSGFDSKNLPGGLGTQGNNGGQSIDNPFPLVALYEGGGGGGGAGGVGGNSVPVNSQRSNGGVGGIGLQSSITGTPIYYGGGGGGGGNTILFGPFPRSSGGLGGGGDGGNNHGASGTPGTVNTGGGGGGSEAEFTGLPGGSGVIIIRYAHTPEIGIDSGAAVIADGGIDAQGSVAAGAVQTITYTVTNSGLADLTLSTATAGVLVNIGTPAISAPISTTLAGSGATTIFTVNYTPSLVGAFSIPISMINNDGDENPYDIIISGIVVPGAADPTNSVTTLAATPASVTADGITTSTVTVTLADANGNLTGATGGTVVLSSTGSAMIGTVTDNGDGTYTATVTNTVTEVVTISGTLAGIAITDTAAVTFTAGVVAIGTSTLVASPTSIAADGTSTTTVTVTLLDGNGNSLTAGGDTVAIATDLGTITSVTDNGDGTYTAILTSGTVAGDATVSGSVNNAALSPAAVTFTDVTAPTVMVSSNVSSVGVGETATITFTLSEIGALADSSKITVTGGTLSTVTGSGTIFTATFTPEFGNNSNGIISVLDAAFKDVTNNLNVDQTDTDNKVNIGIDTINPTVEITGTPDTFSGVMEFSVTAVFSENVTGFAPSDLLISNGSVISIAGSGTTYTITIMAAGTGDVSIGVPAGAAQDDAGNDNLASNIVIVTDNTVLETQKQVAAFQLTRANLLLTGQPQLRHFLTGEGQSSFNVSVARGRGELSFASDPSRLVWMELSASWSTENTSNNRYVFGAIGSHKAISPNFLVGALLEFDYLEQNDGASSVSGTGWLVGPYFVARAAERPLFFEGRLLYGQTKNDISPFGTYRDSFETTRWLAQIEMSGELEYGSATLRPFIDASYTTDKQLLYTDSLGNTIPEQSIALGQLSFGLDFNAPFEVNTGQLELNGGLSGIWSHTSATGNAKSVVPAFEGGRARIEFGLDYVAPNGGQLTFSTFYDGIGMSEYEAYGFTLGYEVNF